MSVAPSASLGRVLDDLGATLLRVVSGDGHRDDVVGGVVIYDPVDEPVYPPHALVLGIGIHEPAEITALVQLLTHHGAIALVIRAPVPLDEDVVDAVRASGILLLELTRGASWTQLAALLRSTLSEGSVGGDPAATETETLAGIPSGDLFALANAIGALLDAPITIEDRSSRVLAFSGNQDEADPSRVETVLGRQVPERYRNELTNRGVFRDLYRGDDPVNIAPLSFGEQEFALPRVAIAVRAGDELLGSIWVAVREPLSEERRQGLREAAKVVALHLLRIRAGADVERRLRTDLVGTALEGGPGAPEALSRLGLSGRAVVVMALATLDVDDQDTTPAEQAQAAKQRQRLTDALAVHLNAIHPRCAVALVGDVAYGIVPVDNTHEEPLQAVARIAEEFFKRTGEATPAVIGLGQVARTPVELARSRKCADRVLRALRSGNRVHRVATLADVHMEVLLLELRDFVLTQGDAPTGPVARLAAYDKAHHTHLVQTLRAWLDTFGDVAAAAQAIFIHPNTLRYRLQRISEVGGIDLTDPDARFAAMLQLRVVTGSADSDHHDASYPTDETTPSPPHRLLDQHRSV